MTRWFPIAPGTTLPAAPAAVAGQITATKTVPVWNETVLLSARTKTKLNITGFSYPASLLTNVGAVATKTKLFVDGQTTIQALAVLEGTAAPVLGSTSTSTYSGWNQIQNQSVDDSYILFSDFGFDFYLAGNAYTGCFVASNGYLTFGAGSYFYTDLDAGSPSQPKIFFYPGDRSSQRIYTRTGLNNGRKFASVRWEGSYSASGTPGSSDLIVELTFYEAANSEQWVEVRHGNAAAESYNCAIASESSYYASYVGGPNISAVYVGNATGTSWTATLNRYVPAAS